MNLDVGAELRRIRESKKLSLRSVATAVGVSASLLSQVETGKTQPSVSTLYALVNHLGVSLDGLMGQHRPSLTVAQTPERGTGASDAVVQRSSDMPTIEMENGVVWERLADGGSNVADPLIVTYSPGGSSSVEGKLMRHTALEYGVLIEGELTLKIDFEEYTLLPGDSFCFDANRPHLYQNNSTRTAKGIWFVIGRREMTYKSLDDLGLTTLIEERKIKSAVDVLKVMKSQRQE
ncbi:MAG TPA: XRE family transcriptional regulator [Actinobacteria bacterium]|jgi:transcriptional regulator with XRE-family HTH domain/quercetin dioxygenase-like cupin family protein|nr:XRE family transcriptional regulator [Actinomycetota bacterium]